jgi:hypothetical protein
MATAEANVIHPLLRLNRHVFLITRDVYSAVSIARHVWQMIVQLCCVASDSWMQNGVSRCEVVALHIVACCLYTLDYLVPCSL